MGGFKSDILFRTWKILRVSCATHSLSASSFLISLFFICLSILYIFLIYLYIVICPPPILSLSLSLCFFFVSLTPNAPLPPSLCFLNIVLRYCGSKEGGRLESHLKGLQASSRGNLSVWLGHVSIAPRCVHCTLSLFTYFHLYNDRYDANIVLYYRF